MSISANAKIHPSAIIEPGAEIAENVEIGAYCCVGERVIIGRNTKLHSHVVVMEDTILGEEVTVYPFASLGQKPQDLKYNGERSRLEIGNNTVIREYVTANIGTSGGGMLTKIGNNCLIMAYCHIAHDCTIGNNVILVNGVNLAGHVTIGDNAIIGGMSAVKQFIRIGKHAMIGGCSGIDRDVIPYGVVRSDRVTTLKGLNIIGLRRRGFSNEEIKLMQSVYNEIFKTDDMSPLTTDELKELKQKYITDENTTEMIDFLLAHSKNPICTPLPTDKNYSN
ncbi:MAG: acyl-ACP--UDP-N-acetylglucosamine O-acyltransferase [Alphaproteobacteria bacterium]|nr:acyl-ACP--UDP-N-acetylglucosamine O-acyltransferase [Alphaproteobacteria bacterium]MBQ3944419.1 acyl-ACP--UDP-N-acetylglucosamine O-acyltransferase [Alphaproteobacteria bacterium]